MGPTLVGTPHCEGASILPRSHATRWEAEQVQALSLQEPIPNAQKNHRFAQIYSLTHITALFKWKTGFLGCPSLLLL